MIATQGATIATVALGDEIDPSNAPRPSNESERLLFRQLYETLVTADCTGRVVPGLAESWRLEPDGRTWIVTLREAAHFSDGTSVSAADVRTGWGRDGGGDGLHPHVNRLVESITVVDARTLAIRLHSDRVDMPLALAHPDLAVAKAAADSRWPLGTRATRIAPDVVAVPAVASATILLERDNRPSIRFLIARGDPRDLLDHGVDLLLTRDPATLDYAATLPSYGSVPLAWQRTYVLLTPGGARSAPSSLTDDLRQLLADDAVRGDARGAQGPFSWQTSPDCGIPTLRPSRSRAAVIPRVVYDENDEVARDLAERLVGLSRAPGVGAKAALAAIIPDRARGAFQRATGLTATALAVAQRRGTDAGYIVSLASQKPASCRDLRALLESAPWLDPGTIVPLVETRLQAVVRRGVSGVMSEWDGGLLIAPIPR